MKITLEFEDYEEAENHIKGVDYWVALWDFHNYLRSELKHGNLTENEWNAYEKIQKKFFEILEENNVNLN